MKLPTMFIHLCKYFIHFETILLGIYKQLLVTPFHPSSFSSNMFAIKHISNEINTAIPYLFSLMIAKHMIFHDFTSYFLCPHI